MEKLSGCAPLDFKMARYIEKLNIRSPEELRYALEHGQEVIWVGFKAMNKLRELAGLPQVQREYSWKDEAKRLYTLLDAAGIKYVKQK
jgi:AMMECR1 domain-containing protein